MHITTLACGPGGLSLVRDLTVAARPGDSLTVLAGTAEDITLAGLRFSPDADALADLLAPREDAGTEVWDRLQAWRAAPQWFTVDDHHLARAVLRSSRLGGDACLAEVMAEAGTFPDGVRLLPMTDDPVESHVVLEDRDGTRAVHAVEWARRRDEDGMPRRPVRVVAPGLSHARPAPGVLDAIRLADVVLVPLTSVATGLGPMIGLPGLRDALRGTSAPVVGVGPELLPSAPGEAETLQTLDLRATSADVAPLFTDVLDALVVPPGDAVSGSFRVLEADAGSAASAALEFARTSAVSG